MLVVRRKVKKNQGYTVLMLPPDIYQEIPTTLQEHQRILEIYKQDKPYEDIVNDFTEFKLYGKPVKH